MYTMEAFHDGHLHVLGLGYVQSLIDLSIFSSIQDVRAIQTDKAIILGRGWHETQFQEKRALTKHDLNAISTNRPVIFTRVCGHVLVCNDYAMAQAGIGLSSKSIDGGEYDIETGVFSENAMSLIQAIIPIPSKEDIKSYFVTGNNLLLEQGITRCGSDDFSTLPVPYEQIIECLKELYEEGQMQIRLCEQVNLPDKDLLQDFINKGYHKQSFSGFTMGPLKLLADGSMGGRTAYLFEDYHDDPGNKGVQVFSKDTLFELIYLADSNDMDVTIHAIGDGMIELVLDAIEASLQKTKRTDHRHSIIHAQLANKKQILRMKNLGVSAIVQPIFLNSDIPLIESRLGRKRARDTYLFHTMFEQGVKVGFSTDAPIEPVNPFYNLYCAMNRSSIKYPHEKRFTNETGFLLEEAIDCYTKTNDWLARFETHRDYIRLNKDITQVTASELLDIHVEEVIINDKVVYKRKGRSA